MATTLTLNAQANVTLGLANVCTRFDPPANARRFRVMSRTNDAKLAFDATLTDGGALGAVAYETLPANVPLEFDVPGAHGQSRNIDTATAASNSRRFFIASATASCVVEVTAVR